MSARLQPFRIMAACLSRHFFIMLRLLFLMFIAVVAGADEAVSVRDAYIPLAAPGAPLAGYVTLVNNSDSDKVIVHVAAPWAAMAMMHESREENGMARMRHLESITLPAHSELRLQPGGKHLMFMRPKQAIHVGDQLDVTFADELNSEITFQFLVRNK